MHEVNVKGILSPHNGMNLYRGCLHGCIYCDARSKCYQINHKFEDIEIKINALELLENKLKSKKNKCMIGSGSMCDPYMPVEDIYHLTRGSLELIDKYGFGGVTLTKSTKVLNDLELIKRINKKTKFVVQMTLTTFDDDLCRILEPNVSVTSERFNALKIFRDNNIPTVVWLTPILPFINDTEENLRGILSYCIEAKVKGIIIWDFGVTLREGDREYFYQKLDEHFPGMKQRYIKTYGNSYMLESPNNKKLKRIFESVCNEHHIMYKANEIFEYLSLFESKEINKEKINIKQTRFDIE